MNELANVIVDTVSDIRKELQPGSDYTAKVTRVEGKTAYVQITGSDIADTPVAMSVSCKAGDMVRVRVADGKAWVTGNDTAPPSDNTAIERIVEDNDKYYRRQMTASDGRYSQIEQTVGEIVIEVGDKMESDMSNRASSITIGTGTIQFNSNTLVVDSSNFKLYANGNATFSGDLSAAGGTFSGIVTVSKRYTPTGIPAFTDTIKIGDSTQYAPIVITRNTGEKSELSAYSMNFTSGSNVTSVMPASISVGNGTKTTYIDPNGVSPGSDRRLKTDIEGVDPGLAKQLRPVRYRFRGEDEVRYGFIAQDVQEVLPNAVKEGANGYLVLNYTEIIAPLCALVQQQEERINQLEARLKVLEEKING